MPRSPTSPTSPTRRRPKKCRACSLPAGELVLLEHGLKNGWSARSLAARFGTVTRRDVQGHMQCVKNKEKEDEC
jgi:hypothetical protein